MERQLELQPSKWYIIIPLAGINQTKARHTFEISEGEASPP